jgi:hypothetical protein
MLQRGLKILFEILFENIYYNSSLECFKNPNFQKIIKQKVLKKSFL